MTHEVTRLSDSYGFLQIARDWNVPYGVVLLLADRVDTLWAGKVTTEHQREAVRIANKLVVDRKSLGRMSLAIDCLREQFAQVKAGVRPAFEQTFQPYRP